MGFTYTEKQQKVLNARSHNIIVSAAAGSGKTAVLVERIIRMITEPNPVTGEPPLDIDRLLVVTFTRAAAAQMRERIAQAIAARLADNPGDQHLQRQETLLHHAQIATIDSFCNFLLRNNFADIDLDPGYRQMDDTEVQLLKGDVWEQFLADQYVQADPAFMAFTDTWCKGSEDDDIGKMVLRLVAASESHPDPIRWLQARRTDYDVNGLDELLQTQWMTDLMLQTLRQFQGLDQMLQAGIALAYQPAGPAAYGETMEQDRTDLFACYGTLDPMAGVARDIEILETREALSPEERRDLYERIVRTLRHTFGRLKSISKADKELVDPALQERVKALRDDVKNKVKARKGILAGQTPEVQLYLMQRAAESLHVLVDLAIGYTEAFRKAKADRNVIDYGDLERYALEILLREEPDETAPEGIRYVRRPAAEAYRSHFAEVLIDEYQDSNEVQELLLSTISGEAEGRYARFMVGDVKQSIYRFRNARPEIFVDKLDHYHEDDAETERIDLDQNFRSRDEVLDATNDVFLALMRREIGGVIYDERVTLKPGARYPDLNAVSAEQRGQFGSDPYRAQLLIVHNNPEDAVGEESAADTGNADNAGTADHAGTADGAAAGSQDDQDAEDLAALPFRKKEALAIAQEIQRMVGTFPVADDEGKLRPAAYRDIVILMRSGGAWIDAFRDICDKEGIPLYVDVKTGYFQAEEIRQVLQALKVIDNPAQDIPLYGMMHGYFGGFSEDELGQIRAAANARYQEERKAREEQERVLAAEEAQEDENQVVRKRQDHGPDLLTAVRTYDGDKALANKCREFLTWLDQRREESRVTPIHEFIENLIASTGYEDYVTALPSGMQRRANLQQLVVKAATFEETQYAGLFEFGRYLDQMRQYEVDTGEANTLDEKANVVRLMTIHKSKGLEFPIVFVSGLAGQFAFKSMDTSGALITDADLGVGMDYIDPDVRARVKTLRKEAVADRIRRASLGEELRVLYVAMTRAKERLIMTGFVKDAQKYQDKIAAARAGILPSEDPHLPAPVIQSATSYLDLLLLAHNANARFDVIWKPLSDMELTKAENRTTAFVRRQTLEHAASLPAQALPVPALAAELESRLSYVYPHADLTGLYTKCSVSDVKHRVIETLGVGDYDDSYDGGLDTADAAYEMFASDPDAAATASAEAGSQIPPEEPEDIPRFVRDTDAAGEGTAPVRPQQLTGAARGTAIHRALELVDYHRWNVPGQVTAAELEAWIHEITAAGLIPENYNTVLTPQTLLPFLQSDVAARMAAADARGTLRREQPFVIGVPADTMNPAFPHTETILVQGIIDAFWIEEGQIVILDYKTDHVKDSQVLIDRYQVQLDYYAQALAGILHAPVKEKLIYSVHLRQTIGL